MEQVPKNIPSAEIIRNCPRHEGFAPDVTIMPKKDFIAHIPKVLSLLIFCVIGIIVSIVAYPLFIVACVLAIVLRVFITLFVKVVECRQKIKVLYGASSFWTAGRDTHVFVQVIQGECDIQSVQKHFTTLLSKQSLLTDIFFRKYGYFCSSTVDNIDVIGHVKYYSPKSQNFPIKEEEIIFDLEKNENENFKSDSSNPRPNWDVLFIPKFLTTDSKNTDLSHFALVFRVSNTCLSLSDAIAYFCHHVEDTQNASECPDTTTNCPTNGDFTNPVIRKLAIVLTAIILGPILFLRSAMITGSKVHTNTMPDDKNGKQHNNYFSKSELFNIEALNILKDGTHSSLKAVLLSSVGTSVRNLLLGLNLDCPDSMRCSYHSSNYCKSSSSGKVGTTIIKFYLGIGLDQPMKRLHSAYDNADGEKDILVAAEDMTIQFILKMIGCFPASAVAQFYKNLHNTNINIEHLIGPSKPFKILGADVVDIYGWSFKNEILPKAHELRTLLISYCGRVRACYIGASGNINPPHVISLKSEFKEEIMKISEICGLNRKILHQ